MHNIIVWWLDLTFCVSVVPGYGIASVTGHPRAFESSLGYILQFWDTKLVT